MDKALIKGLSDVLKQERTVHAERLSAAQAEFRAECERLEKSLNDQALMDSKERTDIIDRLDVLKTEYNGHVQAIAAEFKRHTDALQES